MLLIVELSYGCFSKWPAEKGHRIFEESERFILTAMIVVLFKDSRRTCNSDPIHLNAPSVAQEVDIWSKPTSVVTCGNVIYSHSHAGIYHRKDSQLPQVVRSLVVPTDDYRQNGCRSLASIISGKSICPTRGCSCLYRQVTTRYSLVEVTHSFELCRHRHRLEVAIVSNGFKIATDQEEVYSVFLLCF